MKKQTSFITRYKKELFISFLTILAFAVFVPLFTYSYFAGDLTTKENIMNKNDTGVILLDRNEKPFYTFYQAKYKNFVPLSEIPQHVEQAVIASEDKDYYDHSGFSLKSIMRALFIDITHGKIIYGGSTITQQLVKNALLHSNKTYLRKIQEIILAQEIERRYTKDEILEMYFNSVYFGEGAFGIENAAQVYFGKNAKDLTISEGAFLTAILPSPSAMSPFSGDIKQAKERQKIVLEKMREQKYITGQQQKTAMNEKLAFYPAESTINKTATHFALMVRDELIRRFGEETISRSGFRVKTTIDLTWQEYAEKTVADQVQRLRGDNATNGAAVVMDPKTGDIKALVGSANWFDENNGKLNMAITPRSVGSSFKPIIYAAGFEKNLITPATMLRDEPTDFGGGYRPLNYDRKFRGRVLTRRALANSLNVPAVEVMQKVGVESGIEMAKRLGITTLDDGYYGLSLVLGTGEIPLTEMTSAYATFANQGIKAEPRSILEIHDKRSNIFYTSSVQAQRAISSEISFLISSILSDNQARNEIFGNALTISRPAAVKTGTAEYYKDAFTLGYTPSLTVGVWVGNNNNAPMNSVAGSLGPAPIWKSLMEHYLQNTAVEKFTPPQGVIAISICSDRGLLARGNTASSSATEYFIAGTQPSSHCPIKPTNRPERLSQDNDDEEGGDENKNGEQSNKELRQEMRRKIEERLRRQFEKDQILYQEE